MAKTRKDARGRTLKKGEVQRKEDNLYIYNYTDPLGRRRFIYAPDLVTLREKEKQLLKDQLDGLDTYAAGRSSVNEACWISCSIAAFQKIIRRWLMT